MPGGELEEQPEVPLAALPFDEMVPVFRLGEEDVPGHAAVIPSLGAVGYQWYMNGSAIEGATNVTYAVAWRRGDPDAVSVVPYFDVFGVRTAGTSMSATVAYAPDGAYIIVR